MDTAASETVCAQATLTHGWVVHSCLVLSFALFRLSIDLIQTASAKTRKHFRESHHGAAESAPAAKNKKKATNQKKAGYGSIDTGETAPAGEADPLLPGGEASPSGDTLATWSLRLQSVLLAVLLVAAWTERSCVLPEGTLRTCAAALAFGLVLTHRDRGRERLGYVSRFFYAATGIGLAVPVALACLGKTASAGPWDAAVVLALGLYGVLALAESFGLPLPRPDARDAHAPPGGLSTAAIAQLLRPYVWPDKTSESAIVNRVRAILTWVCVVASKACNLTAPILLGKASTALAHQQYGLCMYLSSAYAAIQFFGSLFKEGQSLIYLRVAQAGFVQLSETTFVHLHRLSLDWHLRKKLGEVMRSMDRGIAACDTLMKYLFLWLVPALAECIIVCVMFATYYSYAPLSIVVFYSVWIYIVWTIILTLQRKKFRKAVVRSDNEWHDRATDSLVNFETVKHFTGEEYERQRFGESIARYQAGSVNVQATLSFLNITQKFILQVCLAASLSLAALGIKQRSDCCIDQGCDSGVSGCCQAIDHDTCPGMEVGDFVAVLTFTMQLFQPLNFLGSVYNAIVMAIVDLTNLSQLLAQDPDIKDNPDAMILPLSNETEEDVAVEFDNVYFHYPTQPESKGLKGISFKMKRGTTTAIVGPTGAGKTTISRLFFRFYDVLGGAVKINGKDVRTVSQKSLRSSIGVVPQSASMFNDTIRENIRYGRRGATQEELEQAARDAQLLGFIESMDNGWDTVVGDRGLKLSGGEKQRAAIARCLLKDPPFVLLDEATSALDTITESSVQEALDRLGSHRTVLVIAHRLGTIRNADKIIVLKDGVVHEEGTHDELLEKDGMYASMWNRQLHSTSNSGSQVSLFTEDGEE
ncbi:unnamed protein product [Pseudo-nitzschia multistriata]|uniref:ABC transporter domain-containing protein n=1 Tax=Pseudo-nitzschia multistriata TaxID=183589 RepID=A0A448Z3N0_9STRA|nr:unnamed protein product [Pseudo-nitzschia multistriata]